MATINLIDHHLETQFEKYQLEDHSREVFKNFQHIDYKNVSKKNLNYFALYIRSPFHGVNKLMEKIPNDIFLLMQQGIIRPLIIMITEQWDLFYSSAWKNKFSFTPDFSQVPYSNMVKHFTSRAVPEENITWLIPMNHYVEQIQFMRRKGYKIKAKFIQYDYFLEKMKPMAKKNKITSKKFKKYFSCLCRGAPRNHRFGIVYNLWREGLIDKGNVSCGLYVELDEVTGSKAIDERVTTSTFMNNFQDWSKKGNTFKSELPIEFDNTDNQHWYNTDENYIFSNSFLWIASETCKKNQEGIYITEKTWKAIAYGSPFCINGDNGSLDYLRQQGYKTFNDYWDESYDHMNDVEKINHISNIVKNICSMDLTDINSLYKEMIPILEHNQQTLIRNTQHNELIQELSNVQS